MNFVDTHKLEGRVLPGRIIYKATGQDGPMVSSRMTVSFGTYAGEYGPMTPHRHAEECVYIVHSLRGRVRYGGKPDALEHSLMLGDGMLLHFPENEWHVFEFDPGGRIDAMFIYGQTDNIRPEDIPGAASC
jgi:hypothetical protein